MKIYFYICFGLLLLLIRPASAQQKQADSLFAVADTLNENITLFENDELLKVTLRFDISQYKRTRSDKDYLDATLTYYISENDSMTKDIKVRSRGIFRREYCDFPPLMLNFKMKDSIKGEFSRINKLKLVTECKPGREELVMKEYLIYKLYNALTDYSYKVKLLRVKYVNTAKQNKSETKYGFVIEPTELLAQRINGVEVKTAKLTQKMVKPEIMDRMAIFNYMIGNTDWSVPAQHNMIILSLPRSQRPDLGVIIPFDFDFSGLVDASYAAPFPGLKIKTIRERQYLGICRDEQVYVNALKEFSAKKEEFYKIINEFPYLKEQTKKEMVSYLDEFFKGINEKNTIAKRIMSDCLSF